MKRPAEAMKYVVFIYLFQYIYLNQFVFNQIRTSTSSRDRRLGPGMGLSAQGGSVARQQLNLGGMSLDRDDGGDVKRARY